MCLTFGLFFLVVAMAVLVIDESLLDFGLDKGKQLCTYIIRSTHTLSGSLIKLLNLVFFGTFRKDVMSFCNLSKLFFNLITEKWFLFAALFAFPRPPLNLHFPEVSKDRQRKWRQRLQNSSLTITIQSLTTQTVARKAQNNRFNERKQCPCTCVLHFDTFLCRYLQNNNSEGRNFWVSDVTLLAIFWNFRNVQILMLAVQMRKVRPKNKGIFSS